ncbi:RidA family protein [Aestuariibius sp. 2305UL40-4]|uniref:RidA family protein n=1 Tax=Aestuariibius violaceus TaxID=3234132 RepID=UPI00345E32EC
MKRFPESMTGKSGAVVAGGLVYAVAFDPGPAAGIAEQTANTLRYLDELLEKAGSGKDRLIQATVYLSDIADKARMDAVWCDWIGGEENWPQRACVGVDLEPGYLIEIVVVAAVV